MQRDVVHNLWESRRWANDVVLGTTRAPRMGGRVTISALDMVVMVLGWIGSWAIYASVSCIQPMSHSRPNPGHP